MLIATMNDQIRQAMRDAIENNPDISQEKLANDLETNQPNISRLLAGRSGQIPKFTRRVLEALGLHLIAVPEEKLEAVKAVLSAK